MGYKVFSTAQSEEWDKVVRSFSAHDIYYFSGYVKAFERNGDGEANLFYFECNSTRAINVFMKRDISEISCFQGEIEPKEYFDIVTPYGYGGFLIEGEEIEKVCEAYEKFCQKSGIVAEFVRFHPLLRNWNGLECLYEEQYRGKTVHMDLESHEIIWNNITSKNRNKIRKAQKAGMEVYWGRDSEIIEQFMEIYNKTMERDNASAYYFFGREFYESILDDLKYNSLWFYTKLDDVIASISIFLFANGNMHYHLSASRKELQNLAPTNLLLYEAAHWGSRNGFKRLHMGGGVGAQEDSLYKFKKAFNRYEDNDFYTGKRIYNDEMYDKLVKLRSSQGDKDIDTNYFPLYRG